VPLKLLTTRAQIIGSSYQLSSPNSLSLLRYFNHFYALSPFLVKLVLQKAYCFL